MKIAILSPHTDDGIFSLGNYIQRLKNAEDQVTIISVFSGIPPISLDKGKGYDKHALLRTEHEAACNLLKVKFINGDFLDDVYSPRPDDVDVYDWLLKKLKGFDEVIAPLGIHHPDHIQLARIAKKYKLADRWYAELPYRVLYPGIANEIVQNSNFKHRHRISSNSYLMKKKAVECYYSQIQSPNILSQLLTEEEIYE